ncbi:MAG: CheR family methyltransferase [Flavobacteriales bacterium]
MRSKGAAIEELELRSLLEAIHLDHHYDFRDYAMASIKRRVVQAQHHFGCESLSALQHRVLHEPGFWPRLLPFFTVQVSEMFRDPAYFAALRRHVIPRLRTYPSLKVWVAGCSTGEELYSLVILFREEGLEKRTLFYATDINREALATAEAGIYDVDRLALFTENHRSAGGKGSLSDHYTAAYGSARLDKSLRERVVFSDHSLVSDQVFAEVQLVSCRNVLIYFNRPLQDRVIGLFKESLVRDGFLGLGSRESLRFTSQAEAFTEIAREERIYQKRPNR